MNYLDLDYDTAAADARARRNVIAFVNGLHWRTRQAIIRAARRGDKAHVARLLRPHIMAVFEAAIGAALAAS